MPRPLFRLGKLVSSPQCSATDGEHSCRLFIRDKPTGLEFLVDTGAEISILPRSHFKSVTRNLHCNLRAANNSIIHTYGDHHAILSLGFPKKKFPHCFLIADVKQPILGADFLGRHGILVDVGSHRLLDSKTLVSVCAVGRNTSIESPKIVASAGLMEDLSRKFASVFAPPEYRAPVVHSVLHRIDTNGPLPRCAPRRLAPDRFKIAKAEFDEMVRLGICRPSRSECSSALLMVAKPNNQWRPCGDYRQLNAVSIPDQHGIPHIHSFADHLHGSKIFSKIDLVKAYHLIPIDPKDIHKTAISTPFGLFEFLRMGFGLRNASQTFQRFMNQVTQGLDFVFVYIDDILVASKNEEEHREHLSLLFNRLQEFGVNVNRAKCTFGVPELDFLGHHINSSGIAPTEEKVRAIREFPRPTSRKQVVRFVGMVNYYHRFVPQISALLIPLHALDVKKIPFVWSEECERGFLGVKDALSRATMLTFINPSLPLQLVCDASNVAVGAVLQQGTAGQEEPLAFFSRKLKDAQQHYSTYDKELLAIHSAVKHFQYMLEGRPFLILTDHKPLESAFKTLAERSPIQKRYLSFISQFSTDIKHIAGRDNVVADALSRPDCDSVEPDPNLLHNIVEAQKEDVELRGLVEASSGPFVLDRIRFPDFLVVCETSTGRHRPYVSASLRRRVFLLLHAVAHPGVKASRRLIAERYFWPSMNVDIGEWAKACDSCQRAKVVRHTRTVPESIPMPNSRFSHIHMDIVGPLPCSAGYRYLLTTVDRYTRWPEAFPMVDMTTATIATTFVREYVQRMGVPDVITTDRGRQFESEFFKQLSAMLGVVRISTSSYHPQGNGMVERFHRTLKCALKAKPNPADWYDNMPLIMLGLRVSLKDAIGASPAELVYGQTLKLPGDFFAQPDMSVPEGDLVGILRERMKNTLPTPTAPKTVSFFIPGSLKDCTHVFVRVDRSTPGLTPPYEGPFRVIRRLRHTFVIDRAGKTDRVNLNRLKPAHSAPADPESKD